MKEQQGATAVQFLHCIEVSKQRFRADHGESKTHSVNLGATLSKVAAATTSGCSSLNYFK